MNYKQGRPTWVPDNSASACVKCKQAFSFDIRRVCGPEPRTFCSSRPTRLLKGLQTQVAAPTRRLVLASSGRAGGTTNLRVRPRSLNAHPSRRHSDLSLSLSRSIDRHEASLPLPPCNTPSSPSLAGHPRTGKRKLPPSSRPDPRPAPAPLQALWPDLLPLLLIKDPVAPMPILP